MPNIANHPEPNSAHKLSPPAARRTARLLVQAGVILLAAALVTLTRVTFEPGAKSLFKPPALAPDEVTLQTASLWNPPPVWIDARSRAAYNRSHLPDARLLTLDETENFEQLLFALDKENLLDGTRPVVVYCSSNSCQLSREVATRLSERYPELKVFILQGGWK